MGSLQEDLIVRFMKLMKKKDPQKAAQIIKKEYFATGPDKKNLKKSVRDFKKKYGYTPREITAKEETLQKRMKHAEACFDAELEMAKEEAMKEMLLDKMVKNQLKRANVQLEKNKFVDTFRCFQDLMHLENTPEANLHNEKVVSLMLYNQGLITRDQFVTLRTEQMKKANVTGIVDFVNSEADNKKEHLLNLIKDEVASLQEKAKDAEKGAADVMNINENDPEKLKKAIRAIETSRLSLFRTGYTVYTFGTYGWGNSADEEKKWATDNMRDYGCGNDRKYRMIDSMSNPYSSIIEPLEFLEYYNTLSGKERKALEADEPFAFGRYMNDAGSIIYAEVLEKRLQVEDEFEKKLKTNGISNAKKTQYVNGFTVYKKDDDVVIMKCEMSSLAPLKAELKPAQPTEIVKANFRAEMVNFCEQYAERNKKRSSPAYDGMEQTLKRLKELSRNFPMDVNEGGLQQYKYAFNDLKTKAEKYLKHKEDDFRTRKIPEPEGGYKDHSSLARSSYERKRIELAESILKFANGKLEALDLAGKYKATMEKKRALIDEPNPAMKEPVPENKERVLMNFNEIVNEKNKSEGKENNKDKMFGTSGKDNIINTDHKLQMDPLGKH